MTPKTLSQTLDKMIGHQMAWAAGKTELPAPVLFIQGSPGIGKAQPLDAPILTLNGWSTMGEMKLGTKLASVDGEPSEVVGVYPQGVKDIYRVTFSDGREVSCCAEHLWEVHFKSWRTPRVLNLEQIQELLQDHGQYHGRLYVAMYLGEHGKSDLPLDPWLMGYLLGNGTFRQTTPCVSCPDSDMLDRIRESLPAGLCLVHHDKIDYTITRVEGRGGSRVKNVLMELLKDLGLQGKLSPQKFIPECFMSASRAARLALLRGLFDSDGTVDKVGIMEYGTSSPRLAEQVQELAFSLGCVCTIGYKPFPVYTHKGEKRIGLPAYRLLIRPQAGTVIVTNAKKAARLAAPEKGNPRLRFRSIEYVGKEEAQCIRVSHPRQLYVTEGYVMTHNTAIVQEVADKHGMGVITVDAVQRDAIDIGGLPDIDRSGSHPRTVRAIPDIITELQNLGKPSILLFDDLPSGNRTTMAAIATALWGRTIAGAALPKDCYVVATGNSSRDRVVFHDIPTNIYNRMTRVELTCSIDDWCDWAIQKGYDQRLVASVREEGFAYTDKKWVDPSDPEKAYCTPRGLGFVNQHLQMGHEDHLTHELINGAVGSVPGTQLWARIRLITDLPTLEEVERDPKKAHLPKDAGAQYTIARSLVLHLAKGNCPQIIEYLERLGKEYVVFGLKFRIGVEAQEPGRFKEPLSRLDGFVKWATQRGDLAKELMGRE